MGKPNEEVVIPETEEDLDGLGYLQGKTMDFVNTKPSKEHYLLIQMVKFQTL